MRICCLCALIRGLQNLKAPYKGERVVTFCIVQKVTKKHAGLRPATSIQIAGRTVIVAKMTGFHKVTGNAENGIFPGIAGNDLNRCEVRALQHKIRAKSKRTTVFFANSRLRAVGRGGGGQKRLLWVAVKKVCAKENLLVCENGRFLKPARKGTCKKKFLCVKNGFE